MTARSPSLDDLLGPDEPHASFHDAALLSLRVDYGAQELTAEFNLCVGDPDASGSEESERHRRGRLRIAGLAFWVMEAPDPSAEADFQPPWLTSDGPLDQCETETAKSLIGRIPDEGVAWFLFFNNLNAFAYAGGNTASFQWL